MLTLVFSKDRALQLDACLASFFRQAQDGSAAEIVVLYAASSQRFSGQYAELEDFYGGRVRFVMEADFRSRVRESLRSQGHANPGLVSRLLQRLAGKQTYPPESSMGLEDCVLFLVDDTLFVRPFRLGDAQEALAAHHDALGVSLRLGANTILSYALRREQSLPKFVEAGYGFLKYSWTAADGDFAYPLEVSSSMYRLSMIAPLVRELRFSNPNTLESAMALQAGRLARDHPGMLCAGCSIAFSAPLNRVQRVFENRAGNDPQWSIERLAWEFDQGRRIDVTTLDGLVPSGAHEEVQLRFAPRRESHAVP